MACSVTNLLVPFFTFVHLYFANNSSQLIEYLSQMNISSDTKSCAFSMSSICIYADAHVRGIVGNGIIIISLHDSNTVYIGIAVCVESLKVVTLSKSPVV
jgi:hypothetical protein